MTTRIRFLLLIVILTFTRVVAFGQTTIVTDDILPSDFAVATTYIDMSVTKNAKYNAYIKTAESAYDPASKYIAISNAKSSGIFSTTSKGKVKKVSIEWNSSSTDKACLEFCFKSTTAFTSKEDLYKATSKGKLTNDKGLTSDFIEFDTGNKTDYIGIRAAKNSNVSFLNRITIEWVTEDGGTTVETVSAPLFSLDSTLTYSSPQTLDISSSTVGAHIYYTLDGSNPSSASTLYSAPLTLSSTTTVKAFATKDGYNNSSITTATYQFENTSTPEVNNENNIYVKVTDISALCDSSVFLIVNEDSLHSMSWQDSNNRASYTFLPANLEGNQLTLPANAIATTTKDKDKVRELTFHKISNSIYFCIEDKVEGGYLQATNATSTASSPGNYLRTKAFEDNAKASITFDSGNAIIAFNPKKATSSSPNILRYNHSYRLFSCYKQSNNMRPVQIYQKVVPVDIKEPGYATLYTVDSYVMPEGLTGGIIHERNGNTLTVDYQYTGGNIVPAKSSLILRGVPGKYYCRVISSDQQAPSDNYLHGTVDANGLTYVPGDEYRYYKLTKYQGEMGFWPGAENCAPFKNGAHKAYLALPVSNSSFTNGISIESIDDVTEISPIVTTTSNKPQNIYTLGGKKMPYGEIEKLPAGIYIVNGRIIINK